MKYQLYTLTKVLLIISFLITGCEKDEAGGTATQNMAGEWWVQIKVGNSLVVPDYFKMLSYNTSANVANEMWLDDQEHIWPFKFKVSADQVAKTFIANNAKSLYSNITVTVLNGKVLSNASKGPVSKAVTDSIYFEAAFSDDPGTIYKFTGYARTRFAEDDH